MLTNKDRHTLRALYERLIDAEAAEESAGLADNVFSAVEALRRWSFFDAVMDGDGAWLCGFLRSEGIKDSWRLASEIARMTADEREGLLDWEADWA